jgi:hypothetical protein
LQRVLQTDFNMVGAWITSRTDPLLSVRPTDREGSILWQVDGHPSPCAHSLACLGINAPFANRTFDRNPLINLIEASMARLIALGFNTVTASDGSTITLVDPIGLESAIALTGGAGWTSVPVAFSNGDGTFAITNASVDGFPSQASTPGARPVAGDFGGQPTNISTDGRSDIVLVGAPGPTPPIVYAQGTGAFVQQSLHVANPDFLGWAALAGATPVAGDFDGNGRADVALVGGVGWQSVPIAFSDLGGQVPPAGPFVNVMNELLATILGVTNDPAGRLSELGRGARSQGRCR